MKRIISVLVLVCLMAGMFTLSAWADGDDPYYVNGTGYATWAAAKEAAKNIVADNPAANIEIIFSEDISFYASDKVDSDFTFDGSVVSFFNTTGSVTIKGADRTKPKLTINGYMPWAVFQSGVLTLENFVFDDQANDTGWAQMALDLSGSVTVRRVTFSDDSFAHVVSGDVTFSNCTFNDTDSYYGAYVAGGTATFNDCTFTGGRGIKGTTESGGDFTIKTNGCTFNVTKKAAVEISVVPAVPATPTVEIGKNTYNNNCRALNYEDMTGTTEMELSLSPDAAKISETAVNIKPEETKQLTVNPGFTLEVNDNVSSAIRWTSSDESVVTVDATGLVAGVKPGVATITAAIDGTSISFSAKVTVSNAHSVPSTADNSNMPLWGGLFILFAAAAVLTGKKRRS